MVFVLFKSLFDQVNGFFLAAAESALLPEGSVVPRFRAFKWKIYFGRQRSSQTHRLHPLCTEYFTIIGVTSASHDCVTL